jgi:hypothetical protein
VRDARCADASECGNFGFTKTHNHHCANGALRHAAACPLIGATAGPPHCSWNRTTLSSNPTNEYGEFADTETERQQLSDCRQGAREATVGQTQESQ